MAITQFGKVELLLPMTGANNGTDFTDYSLRQRTVTRTGAVTSTAQSKFSAYGSSGFLSADTHVITTVHATGLDLTTGDFTIEFWVRPSAIGSLVSKINPSTFFGTFRIATTTTGRVFALLGATSSSWHFQLTSPNDTYSFDQWMHVALTRNGSVFTLWAHGQDVGNNSTASALFGTTEPVRVGFVAASVVGATGHYQDLCITKGLAKYTVNFTPPARMTQRELTRTNTGTDSHEYDRAVLFDWNAPGRSVVTAEVPDVSGDFAAADLIDLEYGVAFLKADYAPICRGPYAVDADA
jgi:hypothetical protein